MHGAVRFGAFEKMLRALQLSREELLQKNMLGEYPFLRGDFKIWCLQGRRRAFAARIAFGEEAWWTIKLFCNTDGERLVEGEPREPTPSD